jgi:deoxyribose-phosphate aldolase
MTELEEIAKLIDHSLLHPVLRDSELKEGCKIALKYNVASVCIKPYAVAMAKELLNESDVKVGTVVGFPHGNSAMEIKKEETIKAIQDGATEIDMVINIGKALSRDWSYIHREVEEIMAVCRLENVILKVIFENDFMPNDEYKIKLCEICNEIKVDYIKTSTGFGFVQMDGKGYGYRGATTHDINLMKSRAIPEVKVKAAGGIRTFRDFLKFKKLGVDRMGVSATEKIIKEAKEYYRK